MFSSRQREQEREEVWQEWMTRAESQRVFAMGRLQGIAEAAEAMTAGLEGRLERVEAALRGTIGTELTQAGYKLGPEEVT